MTYSFPASFAEHYRAYRTAFHRKPVTWLGYAFFGGVPVVVGALAVIFRGWTVADVWAQTWYLLLPGPLFVLVGLPYLHRLNVRQQRTGNAALAGDQSITFTDDGFRAWGPLQNTSVLWSGIHEVVESRHYFLVYLSDVHFFFLPKSVVADLDDLRHFLRTHLGARAQLHGEHQST